MPLYINVTKRMLFEAAQQSNIDEVASYIKYRICKVGVMRSMQCQARTRLRP